MPVRDTTITALLAELNRGNRQVESRVFRELYADLRQLATHQMRAERKNHTLQPTALVHEAYLRVAAQNPAWQNRAHFLAVAAQVMRHILVDRARARQAGKRGGARWQVTLSDGIAVEGAMTVDILGVHQALERLAALDERQSRVVELHFFGGLAFDEIGQTLSISERTVKRDWSMARAWLHAELKNAP